MTIKEHNKTKLWIIESLFQLIEHKDYNNITISQIVDKAGLARRTFYRYFKTKNQVIEYTVKFLMQDFASTILKNHSQTQKTIISSYFEFWSNHFDILEALNKAHLSYFIEDNLLTLMYEVAIEVGHAPKEIDAEKRIEIYEKYKFDFTFKLSGLWKVTILWISESPRKSPEEISKIVNKLLF